MAIFSRGKRTRSNAADEVPAAPAQDEGSGADDAAVAAAQPGDPTAHADESVPHVGISVSTFGRAPQAPAAPAGDAAAATAASRPRSQAPETAPAPTETIAGLRDNALLAKTLAELPAEPDAIDLLNVARQMLQGHLFLRVKGDARALIAEGRSLPLAVGNVGDKQFALAYSNGAALQASVRADGDAGTTAMGQPVVSVIRHVLSGTYAGLIVDHASAPARAVLPRQLLEKMLEAYDEQLTVKSLLTAERTPQTRGKVAEALPHAKLWVAINRVGEDGPIGVAEARTKEGARFLEVYSHPLEVVAGARGDRAAPITATQLAKSLRADAGITGIVVDPRGPWIRLTRDDLAPVLALGA